MSALSAIQISKRYNATQALDRVNFEIHAGAVNVLIGENGAGKSTLMKIIAGIERPDSGSLSMNGRDVFFGSVKDATRAGVGIVHQELNLCPNLTVADNIFLGREKTRAGLIDFGQEENIALELLSQFRQSFGPGSVVDDLRVGQQQIVEIVKALLGDIRILILDEPTSALSPAEVDVLFNLIRELKKHGVAIVYISHRLEELMEIGDYVTVLRDGRLQASAPMADVSLSWIITHMLGESRQYSRSNTVRSAGDTILSVQDLRVPRKGGGYAVDCVSADFCGGQITVIYGLLGSGRSELFESIAGVRSDVSGSVRILGLDLKGKSVAYRARQGLFLVSEDRQRDGLFPNLTIGNNLGIGNLSSFTRFGLVSPSVEKKALDEICSHMHVKSEGLAAPITSLSGGNQQKVVLGRCVMPNPKVLLIDEPSRGVDIGARDEIFDRIRELADSGVAVVAATSDLHEALLYADRILVMSKGMVTADFTADSVAESDLVRAANVNAGDARNATAQGA